MSADAFVPTPRSKVKRRPMYASYDRDSVYRLLDAGLVCHIAYVIDGQPFVTPTAYWRSADRIFWHGSAASRMLRSQAGGIPVCLTVTHVDALVVARSAFHHSINYRSVMAFGRAAAITDAAAKEAALHALIERLYPGRWPSLRPVLAQELAATMVMSMRIEEAAAKARSGAREDEAGDYAWPLWAGVLPLETRVGRIEPDARLMPGVPLPPEVARYAVGGRLDAILSDLARENPAAR